MTAGRVRILWALCLAGAAWLAFSPTMAVPARAAPAAKRAEGKAAREAKRRQLAALLSALWERQAQQAAGAAGEERDWAEADRRQVWTRRLLEALDDGQGGGAVKPQKDAASHAPKDAAQGAMGRGRDAAATAPGQSPGSPGDDSLEPLEFAAPANGLSWPAPGRLLATFSPAANPPRQGVVLAAPEGTPVAAAADGQVVFVGGLRGLGHIVILDHGARRHTVYGCLGRASVREGDLVARGESLGPAGYCGLVKAPGVYFELRFREKALNPAEWLAARR